MTAPVPDWFKEASWLGFIQWAFGEESLRSQFEEVSEAVFVEPARGGIESLIDQACGVDERNTKYFKAFIVWVTENYWGPDEDCPAIFFEKFKDKPSTTPS